MSVKISITFTLCFILTTCYSQKSNELCPLLSDETVDINCSLNSKTINCSESIEGTKLKAACKPFFNSQTPRTLSTCTNGKWVPEIQPCILECGRSVNPQTLIIGGSLSEQKVLPWVVRIVKDDFTLCLGSLISTKHILSTAHYFTDLITGDLLNINNYKIVAGNSNANKQIRDIDKVFIHASYRGKFLNYQYDIAMVVVKDNFMINLLVQPVCIDYNNENGLIKGNQGIAFGIERSLIKDQKIIKLIMNFEDQLSCKEKSPQDFYQSYYSPDKMCASYLEASSCGLGGSGFYIKSNEKYYLKGIISLAPVSQSNYGCDAKLPTYLTNTFSHTKWLKEIVESY